MTDEQVTHLMYDAIEGALWQDLAEALNRMAEHGLRPIDTLCELAGAPHALELHGDIDREPGLGYYLRYQPPFQCNDDGTSKPFGWTVEHRSSENEGGAHTGEVIDGDPTT